MYGRRSFCRPGPRLNLLAPEEDALLVREGRLLGRGVRVGHHVAVVVSAPHRYIHHGLDASTYSGPTTSSAEGGCREGGRQGEAGGKGGDGFLENWMTRVSRGWGRYGNVGDWREVSVSRIVGPTYRVWVGAGMDSAR